MARVGRAGGDGGFLLLEVVVAAGLLATALVAAAQLLAVAARSTIGARETTIATMLAAQKLEELVDSGAASIPASPSGTLDVDTNGYVDYVDPAGRVSGDGMTIPAEALYVRRWSVEPLPADGGRTFVFQVVVARRDRLAQGAGRPAAPDVVRLVTVRARPLP